MADVVQDLQPKPKRKVGLAAILIPIAVLSICGGALFSFSQYAVVSRVVATALGTTSPQAAADGSKPASGAADAEQEDEDEEDEGFGLFHEITGMTVNPAETGGSRYLLVNVALEASDQKTIDQIGEREFVVRDAMLNVMAQKTVPELADITQREALKDTLLYTVNQVIDEGQVRRFYFTQYVMQ
jgi:flagellar FliL protein